MEEVLQELFWAHFLGHPYCSNGTKIHLDVALDIYNLPVYLLLEPWQSNLKLASTIFIKFLFFHQLIALQKLWKMLFISSKKLFLFLKYSNFCISVLPSFSAVTHCFRGRSKINLKVYDVINCLNKNSVTHFVWYLQKKKRYDSGTLYIDGVSDKEHLYRKIMQKMCSKSRSQTSL